MEEIWKDIPGYNGKYQVSNMGKVRAMWRNNQYEEKIGEPHLLKQSEHRQGYLKVYLSLDGESKGYYVHRLVAEAFIPNPDNLPQVNHKSEIKSENFVDNLEWCDGKYNSNYGTRPERHGKLVSKPIIQYDLNGNIIGEYKSAKEIEDALGYNAGYISLVCNGHRPQAYGYLWKFKKSPEAILAALDELFEEFYGDE